MSWDEIDLLVMLLFSSLKSLDGGVWREKGEMRKTLHTLLSGPKIRRHFQTSYCYWDAIRQADQVFAQIAKWKNTARAARRKQTDRRANNSKQITINRTLNRLERIDRPLELLFGRLSLSLVARSWRQKGGDSSGGVLLVGWSTGRPSAIGHLTSQSVDSGSTLTGRQIQIGRNVRGRGLV